MGIKKISLLSIFGMSVVATLAIYSIKQPLLAAPESTPLPTVSTERLRADVEHLSIHLAQRHVNQPEVLRQAAEYIRAVFDDSNAQTELQTFQVNGTDYHNVIAHFGPKSGEPIVIGAHYDAEENTMGADDNASGVAGLLALARLFKHQPPAIPVTLVAYTLEEPPNFRTENMGSRHHALSLAEQSIQPRLVMVLEMIGYFDDTPHSQTYPIGALKWLYPNKGNFIAVVGNFSSMRLVRKIKTSMRASTNLPVESINAPTWLTGIDFSDHASYWQHNMPAVMITDTSFYRNPNYHQASDTADTLDFEKMSQVVQSVYGVVKQLEGEARK